MLPLLVTGCACGEDLGTETFGRWRESKDGRSLTFPRSLRRREAGAQRRVTGETGDQKSSGSWGWGPSGPWPLPGVRWGTPGEHKHRVLSRVSLFYLSVLRPDFTTSPKLVLNSCAQSLTCLQPPAEPGIQACPTTTCGHHSQNQLRDSCC